MCLFDIYRLGPWRSISHIGPHRIEHGANKLKRDTDEYSARKIKICLWCSTGVPKEIEPSKSNASTGVKHQKTINNPTMCSKANNEGFRDGLLFKPLCLGTSIEHCECERNSVSAAHRCSWFPRYRERRYVGPAARGRRGGCRGGSRTRGSRGGHDWRCFGGRRRLQEIQSVSEEWEQTQKHKFRHCCNIINSSEWMLHSLVAKLSVTSSPKGN